MFVRTTSIRLIRTYYKPSPYLIRTGTRYLTTHHPNKSTTTTPPPAPQNQDEKSWLARQVEASPLIRNLFFGLTNLLGYGSPKQVAGRRAFAIYEQIAATAPDAEREFWHESCYLPPTFQSWFTVTNLHVWMLTVRFRALPKSHGRHYEQALIDHFFLDIEDRIRAVLQPPSEPTKPYTFHTSFYVNPNANATNSAKEETTRTKKKKRKGAPDGTVTKQMKIFKEQWQGMGIAFDLSLIRGDMEMAAAVWRNFLGARGAQGIITYPTTLSSSSPNNTKFRRSVNLVGGEVVNINKLDLDKEERIDDGSGVYDFPPEQADRYLSFPTVMLDIVGYVRRELVRLQAVSDEDILEGNWEKLKFGRVKKPVDKSPNQL